MLRKHPLIDVIIPAFNEENSIGNVLREIPENLVREVVVVDNNSSDRTRDNARKAGAVVMEETRQGYGSACLKGIDYLKNKEIWPDIVVFLDADYSDYPEEMTKLVSPVINDDMDMVIGSRELGVREKGSMTFPQIFGNRLSTFLLYLIYKVRFTDLGPFRAINFQKLLELNMKDQTYGWTVEMQVKAAKKGFRVVEIPVSYRKRIGFSKISGTVKGTVMAGYKIIVTIFKYI